MPNYEYECSSCKFYSEILQKISDAPLKKCPSCGRSTMKKLISAPSFRLKGAGWYETDFKSDQENKRNLADREEKADKAETDSKTKSEDSAPAKTVNKVGAKKPAAKSPSRKAKASRKAVPPKKAKRKSR